ncbi:unnamed protein product [Pylaiella littoralis]
MEYLAGYGVLEKQRPAKARAVPNDTRLIDPEGMAVSGQLEPGLIVHACPVTEVGRRLPGITQKTEVLAINSGQGGGSAEPTLGPETPGSGVAQEYNSDEARRFGERLCEITASEWAVEENKDPTASLALTIIAAGNTVEDIPTRSLPSSVVEDEVKRLVAQGTIIKLTDSKQLLVWRSSRVPTDRPNRRPGKYERLLGEEPVRTYVPLELRPWVMDCAHKEVVHLDDQNRERHNRLNPSQAAEQEGSRQRRAKGQRDGRREGGEERARGR